MTKTLPASVGPAHQAFRRPGVGRAFSERPGSAVSFCFPPEHRAFMRWLAADTEAELKAAARSVLADAATQREECGTRASGSPATLTDSAETTREPDLSSPRCGTRRAP
ncbi:Imm21 family immunity protein [Streptomyces sp. NBC_01446]|uniref:Imm21 family immunity protein n=1 Tax=Streptomyces sp. NBC_01446 TaxID=2903870 RepID=UPI00224C952B|nr:Imm21 family immunity protein [Streptomyces sp. NBC_01446]MCX4641528.1 immunity 21 family protein [Streptomyces sp. NBC_01446]